MSSKGFSGFKMKTQTKPTSLDQARASSNYQQASSAIRPSYAPNFSRKHATEEE